MMSSEEATLQPIAPTTLIDIVRVLDGARMTCHRRSRAMLTEREMAKWDKAAHIIATAEAKIQQLGI
jgi:hypothetical protein